MIGFLAAGWRAAKNAPRYGLKPEDVWDVALFGLLGGVLGGRIGFVVQEPGFWHNPGQIFAIWTGGRTGAMMEVRIRAVKQPWNERRGMQIAPHGAGPTDGKLVVSSNAA